MITVTSAGGAANIIIASLLPLLVCPSLREAFLFFAVVPVGLRGGELEVPTSASR
jgi:hypothetical protein